MSEKKLALIATKGTLDWAYPPFILASTAAAIGYETQIFFTFYGLQLLKKDLNLKVSPLGNPGMPMPLGMDKWFPNLGTALPGMEAMMSGMMKSKMKSKGVASVAELRELCLEADGTFLWESERSGHKHLYHYRADGELIFSKHETGRFPDEDEIVRKLQSR